MAIRKKLILIYGLTAIITLAVVGTLSVTSARGKVMAAAREKLRSDAALGSGFLGQLFLGPWQIVDGNIFKGRTEVGRLQMTLDEIAGMSGGAELAIFQGEIAVATTIENPDGTRALGVKAANHVAEVVLKEGRPDTGREQIGSFWYQTYYEPIRDQSDRIIGMWFVGISLDPYEALARALTARIILFSVAGMVLVALVSLMVSNHLSAPLEKMVTAVSAMGEGDLTREFTADRSDEVGRLGRSFRETQRGLRQMVEKIAQVAGIVAATAGALQDSADQVAQASGQVARQRISSRTRCARWKRSGRNSPKWRRRQPRRRRRPRAGSGSSAEQWRIWMKSKKRSKNPNGDSKN